MAAPETFDGFDDVFPIADDWDMVVDINEPQQVREAKRRLVAQPEISHEAAEAVLRSQTARTDEKFSESHTPATSLLCHTATRTCFSSAHNAVPSTLVDR